MEDDSKREDIAGRCVGLDRIGRFYFEDLRGNIAWSSTSCVEIFVASSVLSETEIDDNRDYTPTSNLISLDHDVLKF